MYDTTWSELNENHIAVACGDGSVKLFDTTKDNFPLASWQEHNREVYAVTWNLVSKDTFASSSWDGTIKIVCLTTPRFLTFLTEIMTNSTWTVVSDASCFGSDSPNPLVHLFDCLLSSLTVYHLVCIVRFPHPRFRSANPSICHESSRPPHPNSRCCTRSWFYLRCQSSAQLPTVRGSHT